MHIFLNPKYPHVMQQVTETQSYQTSPEMPIVPHCGWVKELLLENPATSNKAIKNIIIDVSQEDETNYLANTLRAVKTLLEQIFSVLCTILFLGFPPPRVIIGKLWPKQV